MRGSYTHSHILTRDVTRSPSFAGTAALTHFILCPFYTAIICSLRTESPAYINPILFLSLFLSLFLPLHIISTLSPPPKKTRSSFMADDRNVPTSRPCAKDQNRTSHNLMCTSLPLLLSPLHPPKMRLRLGYDQFHHLSLKLFDDFHMSGIKKATTSIFMCAKGLNRLGLHLVCVRVF